MTRLQDEDYTASESKVEKFFIEMAHTRNFLTFKFVSPSRRGVPDRILITDYGDVYFVELKTKTGTLSALQVHTIELLNTYKQRAVVLRGIKDVKTFYQGLDIKRRCSGYKHLVSDLGYASATISQAAVERLKAENKNG